MKTKISKRLIKKAGEIIPDDTGSIDSLETLIDSAKLSVYCDWIDELCKGRANASRIFYNLSLHHLDGDYYLQRIILFLETFKEADTNQVINYIKSMQSQKQIT